MWWRIVRWIPIVSLFTTGSITAQILDTLPVQRPSSLEGTRFLISFMENEIYIQPAGLRLRVLIASSHPNTIEARYPNGTYQRFNIQARQVVTLVVPDTFEVRQNQQPTRKAIEITSELPVSVYAISSQYTTSDSYTVIPVDLWGKDYTIMSMPNDTYGDEAGSSVDPAAIRQSEFMIVARDDHTTVQIFPSALTEAGNPAKQWFTVLLHRGECYLVKSYPSPQGTGDLTGTIIRASKPIGVLSGHVRASIPLPLPQALDSKDHLVEMLLPKELLSTSYMTVPFATDARLPIGDYLRAVAIEPDTRITIYTEREDLSIVLSNPGDTMTLPRVNSPTWWRANKPFILSQFMTTGPVANAIMSDPAMVMAPPLGRFIGQCVFQTPSNLPDGSFAQQFEHHWLNLICDERARHSIKLDGRLIARDVAPELATQVFRSSRLFWAQIPIKPGIHVLETDSGTFTGILYGTGFADSYAHMLGLTNFVGRDTLLPVLSTRDSCGWVIGTARDNGTAGLAYCTIEPDSTINYGFFVTNDTLKGVIHFQARLVDPLRDGSISIVVRDRAGNGLRYRFRYRAPKVLFFPQPVRMIATLTGDTVCTPLTLRNYSFDDTVTVNSIYLGRGGSSKFFYNAGSLPIKVLPRSEVVVNVCFSTNVAGSTFDTLRWDLGCGRIFRIPIEGKLSVPGLTIEDVDFGKVVIGDTSCRVVNIINTGTEMVTITGLSIEPPREQFHYLTLLPRTLQPRDTVSITICFSPIDTGSASAIVRVLNEQMLDVRGIIHGRGIRPELATHLLDCGARRVGLRFDTIAVITNRGSADALLRFNGQDGAIGVIMHSLRAGDTIRVPPNGFVPIPIRFTAPSPDAFTTRLIFETVKKGHLVLEIRGIGTLPRITVRDTIVGPVRVGQRSLFNLQMIESGGNESLTIDSVWVEGPDAGALQIDPIAKTRFVVSPGATVQLPIFFGPQRVGIHQVQLKVLHDASPNYIRNVSTALLQGIAIERDTSEGPPDTTSTDNDSVAMHVTGTCNPSPLRCENTTLFLEIMNRSDNALRITRAEVSLGRISYNIISYLPATIPPNDRVRIRTTLPSIHEKSLLVVTIVANDTIQRTWRQEIIPRIGSATVIMRDIEVEPDHIVMVRIEGDLFAPIPSETAAHVSVMLPAWLVEYHPRIPPMIVQTCDGVRKDVLIESYKFTSQRVDIYWQIPRFTFSCSWFVEVPVRSLFSTSHTGQVMASVWVGDCYDTLNTTATINIMPVCGQNLRGVELSGMHIVSVISDPATGQIRCELEVYSPGVSTVWITDIVGRKKTLGRTPYLERGRRVIIFDHSLLPLGWYALTVQTDVGSQSTLCCFLNQ